jgi:DNA-binding HxlR family transcriptional regulator
MAKSYDQYCSVAAALDVIGERWSLLILRDLLDGPKRYTDLQRSLTGIAPNLLADRLRDLQAAGVVEKRELPPPAARSVFALTKEGRGLEPVFVALSRWGIHRLGPLADEDDVPPAIAMMSGLMAYVDLPATLADAERRWTVHLGERAFAVRLARGRVRFEAAPSEDPDADVRLDPRALLELRRGEVDDVEIELVDGTADAVDELREVFALP